MDTATPPDLAAFLDGPIAQVQQVAPRSVVLALGGTRRSAALNGVNPRSPDYATSQREPLLRCIELLFASGVEHLFLTPITAYNAVEYAENWAQFTSWVAWGIAGDETLAHYSRHGWRARLLGAADIPELHDAEQRLLAATPSSWQHTIWWSALADADAAWRAIFAALQHTQVRTRADAIYALYGEAIPPISMLLSFGKPIVNSDLLPPLLVGDVQCYWIQRAGYNLDQTLVRRIVYDYGYLRPTRAGRALHDRYAEVPQQRAYWAGDTVLGLGRRLGGFWYPQPTRLPEGETESTTQG